MILCAGWHPRATLSSELLTGPDGRVYLFCRSASLCNPRPKFRVCSSSGQRPHPWGPFGREAGGFLGAPALSLRLLLGVAAPQGTRRPCQSLHQLSPPNPLRTSRIFSPSHRRPGVWSGFLGRGRTDTRVRASLCILLTPACVRGITTWGFSPGPQEPVPGLHLKRGELAHWRVF